MGKRWLPLILGVLGIGAGVFWVTLVAFRRPAPAQNVPQSVEPSVASITPAGTDLVIGIGAGNHLVAVSDLDEDRDGTTGLPRVGDFDHIDWEKLAMLGPKILLTQFGNRMPQGLRDRCGQMGIRLIDVHLDVIEDIYRQADILGAALDDQDEEAEAVKHLQQSVAAVRQLVSGYPTTRAAIVLFDGSSLALIGPGTFHDQLLTIAGGVNVAAKFGKPYIVVDREQLMALSPDVVLDLEPTPPTTPQQMAADQRFWASLPDLPAVKKGQVKVISAPYCLRPGWHIADLAQIFARELHSH